MKNTIVAAIGWVCTDVDCPTVAVNIAYLVWLSTGAIIGLGKMSKI
jgi:hypothetical protein